MSEANKMQVGGEHYKSEYQHWDWAVHLNLGNLEYAATKYMYRHQKKNGIEDIKKAIHYATKLKEVVASRQYVNTNNYSFGKSKFRDILMTKTHCFLRVNEVPTAERLFCIMMVQWRTAKDVDLAIMLGKIILNEATRAAAAVKTPPAATTPPATPSKATAGQPAEATDAIEQGPTCPNCGSVPYDEGKGCFDCGFTDDGVFINASKEK